MDYTSKKPQLLNRDRCAVLLWLALAAALVALMVLIGGYTRLSGSGLSITEWKPVHGIVPPLNDAQWQEEFAGYRASPQFEKINSDMTLDGFKIIYWPEYIHRLLGRALGVVFFLPLLVFVARRSLKRRLFLRLLGIFALGGLQGCVGWIMVASGLVDAPYVSHIKLAAHLMIAFAIFGCILWTVLDIARPWRPAAAPMPKKPRITYHIWFLALLIQLVLGAFMAGLHAGLVFNTWPSMNGAFWPDFGIAQSGIIHNVTLVQFAHRNLALVVAFGFLFWWYLQAGYVKNAHLGKVCAGVTAIIGLQFILGVLTLVNEVPLPLALAHQMVALVLFAAAVTLMHGLTAAKTTRLQ